MLAYVGCRTTRERQARGVGIEVFEVVADGPWRHLRSVPAGENPSYLTIDGAGRCLYAVHGDGDTVSAFRIGAGGRLDPLNEQRTEGRNPVHLTFSPDGRWLLIANYASGSVVSLPIEASGALGAVAARLQLPDLPGPHRAQQRGAHPHQLVFDPSHRWLLVPDKGSDAVHTLAFDTDSGALRLVASLATAPGSGPRHLVVDPAGVYGWVVLELSSQLLAVTLDTASGRLVAQQRTSTVPDRFTSENTGAGIVLDGRSLWVSNRGHGSVVRFAVDAGSGAVGDPSWAPVGGSVPRFICADPLRGAGAVLVANEDADTLVAVGAGSSHELRARTGSPVCIVFAGEAR